MCLNEKKNSSKEAVVASFLFFYKRKFELRYRYIMILKHWIRSIGPSMFEAEALGLRAMYETRSIRVPKPFKVWAINFVYITNYCLCQHKPIVWQLCLSEPVAKHCRLDPYVWVVPALSWNSLNLVLPEASRWDWKFFCIWSWW